MCTHALWTAPYTSAGFHQRIWGTPSELATSPARPGAEAGYSSVVLVAWVARGSSNDGRAASSLEGSTGEGADAEVLPLMGRSSIRLPLLLLAGVSSYDAEFPIEYDCISTAEVIALV